MHRVPTLWKANIIAFISSFCVMVIELIAARLLAPFIGVSLYTWTSIIGVILTGIALGNYLGGKVADRYPSPLVLALVFLAGSILTIAILPLTKIITFAVWFDGLPLMLNFVLKIAFIFFLPAIVLSMVSPLVIKLTLAHLGQTGGVVGTIYAFSTAGAILGTFMTGFYLILWFGTRTVVWLVGCVLILTAILAWFSWKVPGRWKLSPLNLAVWLATLGTVLAFLLVFQTRAAWQESFTKESNYYAIKVINQPDYKILVLDRLVHSYVKPDDPGYLKYDYLRIFAGVAAYMGQENPELRLLHLGGGGYSFPRYMETFYPASTNEVVEIDPAVTEVAHRELGLPADTRIKTYARDARLFLMQRRAAEKYDIVIGDVFNDFSTPYHLTTLEFARLVKVNMTPEGIYLINIIDDGDNGRYMPSFVYTLQQAFRHVYLFTDYEGWTGGLSTFVIGATDQRLDLADYRRFIRESPDKNVLGYPRDEAELAQRLDGRDPILLTDDYVPTDILIAPLIQRR
ncbi:MAG: fused MFS/spermidine synthase [Chloroflexi bacterium]|nr:fused MFS/spermidine synthase [Chloroflexota bacterium]